jgi:symplekin
MVVDGGESLLRAWTLDMVALTVGRSGLKLEIKEEGKRDFGIAHCAMIEADF